MTGKIQEIRKKLYLRRDGASSSSMRKKGIDYAINFGVPITTLKEIAGGYNRDASLANALWEKNTRELKILATLLQEPGSFSEADEWVEGVNNPELAEQLAMNLLIHLPGVGAKAACWIQSDKEYTRLTGFLTYMRLFMYGFQLEEKDYNAYLSAVWDAVAGESILVKNAAVNSLRHLGRQSAIQAENILASLDAREGLPVSLKEELREDLLFEFNYE